MKKTLLTMSALSILTPIKTLADIQKFKTEEYYLNNRERRNINDLELEYKTLIELELVMPVIDTIGVELQYLHTESNLMDMVETDNIMLMIKTRF